MMMNEESRLDLTCLEEGRGEEGTLATKRPPALCFFFSPSSSASPNVQG